MPRYMKEKERNSWFLNDSILTYDVLYAIIVIYYHLGEIHEKS